MSDPVFFVDEVLADRQMRLAGDEGHHAAAVRRMRVGERLVVGDGAGTWAPAVVSGVDRHSLTVTVGPAAFDPPVRPSVTLVQALPKGERSDLVVELATEAGIDAIIPWQAARCIARWSEGDGKAARGRERWQRVAREASKQSRRTRIPEVAALAGTSEVAKLIAAAPAALVLHESGGVPMREVALPGDELLLVVGPEGGIAPEEISLFQAAGARTVILGREVLRTSTAAAVALGALGVLTARWP